MCSPITKVLLSALVLFSLVGKSEALNNNTAYMVTGNGSTTLSHYNSITNEYTYDANQTPWVYLKLQLSDLNLSAPLHVLWSWSNSANPLINETQLNHISLAGLGSDKELWSPAPEPWWSANSTNGQWTVDVAWLNASGAKGTSSATFNVTPEPISSALFLFGGIPVAAALLRKKKLA